MVNFLTPLIDRIPVSLDARGHGLEEVVAITVRARHRLCIHLSGSCKLRLGRLMTSSVPCSALGGRGSGLVLDGCVLHGCWSRMAIYGGIYVLVVLTSMGF